MRPYDRWQAAVEDNLKIKAIIVIIFFYNAHHILKADVMPFGTLVINQLPLSKTTALCFIASVRRYIPSLLVLSIINRGITL